MWKWILAALAALVLGLLVAAYVVLQGYDWNNLKPALAQAVKDGTGRELTIAGDIQLKLGLKPSLVVSDVTISNASWGKRPYLAKIKRFELMMELWPLFSRQVVINRLVALEPEVFLETSAQGKSNLDMTPAKPSAKANTPTPPDQTRDEGDQLAANLAIKELLIKDGKLLIEDHRTGQSVEASLDKLLAGSEGPRSPIGFDLDALYNKQPVKLSGRLGSLAGLGDAKPWPIKVQGQLGPLEVKAQGELKNPAAGQGIMVEFQVSAPDLAKLAALSGQPVPLAGPFHLSGTLSDPQEGRFRLDKLKLTALDSDLAGWLEVDTKAQPPALGGELTSDTLDLRKLAQMDQAPAAGQAAGGQGQTAQDKAPATGQGAAPTAGQAKAAPAAGGSGGGDKVFPADPLPLEGLREVDLDLTYRAKHILTPSLALSDLEAKLNLAKGALGLEPFRAKLGGGAVEGGLELAPHQGQARLAAKLTARDCDLGAMLKELKVSEDLLDGTLALDADLKGQGASVAGIMARLDGRTVVTVKEGKIHNRLVNLVGGDIQALFLGAINPLDEKKPYTQVNCFVQGFQVEQGLAKISALLLDTDQMTVWGEGHVNLRDETLDIGIKPAPKKSAGLEALLPAGLSLGEVVKPFKLTGTLAHPQVGVDIVAAAQTIGKTAAGIATFGGVGALAGLLSLGEGDQNPCQTAEALARGQKPPDQGGQKQSAAPAGPDATQSEDNPAKEAVKGLGDAMKGLFGQ